MDKPLTFITNIQKSIQDSLDSVEKEHGKKSDEYKELLYAVKGTNNSLISKIKHLNFLELVERFKAR